MKSWSHKLKFPIGTKWSYLSRELSLTECFLFFELFFFYTKKRNNRKWHAIIKTNKTLCLKTTKDYNETICQWIGVFYFLFVIDVYCKKYISYGLWWTCTVEPKGIVLTIWCRKPVKAILCNDAQGSNRTMFTFHWQQN